MGDRFGSTGWDAGVQVIQRKARKQGHLVVRWEVDWRQRNRLDKINRHRTEP